MTYPSQRPLRRLLGVTQLRLPSPSWGTANPLTHHAETCWLVFQNIGTLGKEVWNSARDWCPLAALAARALAEGSLRVR